MGDAFWDSRGATVRKRKVQWFEQPELWKEEPVSGQGAKREMPERVATPIEVIEEVAYVRTAEAGSVRGEATSYRDRRQAVRMAEIAKFLQVNRGLDGLDAEEHRFSLPIRSFAARFSRALWKGSPVGTPFLTGC